MIRIQMNRLKHTVELELPTDYERVLVCLWKLGLRYAYKGPCMPQIGGLSRVLCLGHRIRFEPTAG